jgi:hypothetical protein
MLESAKEEILKAVKKLDSSISSLRAAEQWYPIRVHTVSLERYLNSTEIEILRDEIETTNTLNLPSLPRWINRKRVEERYNKKEIAFSTVIIRVHSKTIADSLIAKGLEFEGKKYTVELFKEIKAEVICSKYLKFGHNSFKPC